MTTCSESGQVRKEAAIRSLCRASESIECAILARFYQTAQCSTLRATQSDNLSFKRQGMTRRSMPCLFHANLFALDVARWHCLERGDYAIRPAARYLVSRWSSASPAGSLDYQTPCRLSRVADQKAPEGSHLFDNLIPCFVVLAGVAGSAVATWFMRRRCCLLFWALRGFVWAGSPVKTCA